MKYKRCCLAAEREGIAAARREAAVGPRILEWSALHLPDELEEALDRFGGAERAFVDGSERELFSSWFHNDRELADGRTPAELYRDQEGLTPAERQTAARIASARLGLYRVTAVEPGSWLELEDLLEGERVRVHSRNVSTECVRWDILLARVMDGEPASLWGSVRPFGPAEEGELIDELRRLGREAGEALDGPGLRRVLRDHALEMARFLTPSSQAERSFYTLEGHPLIMARARWGLEKPEEARERLTRLGAPEPAFDDGEAIEVEITVPKSALLAERGENELPPGAIVIELSAIDDPERVPVATVRVEADAVSLEAMSEERLERGMELIERDLGDLLAEPELELEEVGTARPGEDEPVEERASRDGEAVREESGDPIQQMLVLQHMRERPLRWLDEPEPRLGGMSPREAVAAGRSSEVVPLARTMENGAMHSAAELGDLAEIDLLGELGLDDARAA